MSGYNLDTPYSNQFIFLNSENSIYKSVHGQGEYAYNFQTPIQLPTNCQMLISVTDAQLPNIMPNVNSTNNKISFFIPTFSKYFTIELREDDGTTDRVYTVNQFLSYVNAKIILEASGQFSLYGEFIPSMSKVKWYSNFPFQIIDNVNYRTTCIDLLGFKKNNHNEVVYENDEVLLSSLLNPTYHITMPSCVNFTGTRYVFAKFKNISVNNLNSNGIMDNAMVRIDNNVPFGYMIFYRPSEIQCLSLGNKQSIILLFL